MWTNKRFLLQEGVFENGHCLELLVPDDKKE